MRLTVDWRTRALEAEAEAERLRSLINTPHTEDFLEAVGLEAAHQFERWPPGHDQNKSDADWLWLLGWLAAKAVHAATPEKRLHHIITSAAVCLNWHRARAAHLEDAIRARLEGEPRFEADRG